jgi:predicted metal-dependent hydrolase
VNEAKKSIHNSANLSDCTGKLPSAVRRGLELFNTRQYFLAHEALEEAWLVERGPIRDLYKGVLQAGVTYLHIQRENYRGAIKVYQRAALYLAQYPDHCCGLNVAQLRIDLDTAIAELKHLGPDRLNQFDAKLFKPIIWRRADQRANQKGR